MGQRHRARARGQPGHNKHTHTYTQNHRRSHRPEVHIKLINNGPEPHLDIVTETSGQHCFSVLMSFYVSFLFVSCLAIQGYIHQIRVYLMLMKTTYLKQAGDVKLKSKVVGEKMLSVIVYLYYLIICINKRVVYYYIKTS